MSVFAFQAMSDTVVGR